MAARCAFDSTSDNRLNPRPVGDIPGTAGGARGIRLVEEFRHVDIEKVGNFEDLLRRGAVRAVFEGGYFTLCDLQSGGQFRLGHADLATSFRNAPTQQLVNNAHGYSLAFPRFHHSIE